METLIQNHYPHELAKPRWQEAAGYLVRAATGDWDTLICRVPVSAKPIMARAPISMQIVIN